MAYEPTLDDVLNSLYGPEGGLTEEELAQYMPEPYVAPEYTPAPQGGGYAPVARGEAKLGGPRTPYDELIYQKAVAAGQDPNLIKAQIWAESSFNPKAVSHAGAQGLTQFMPGTWNKYGRGSPFDPNAAIDAQIAYNADLLQRFGGDERKVLAAYNWGEHRKSYALPDWERHAPAETRDYVKKILAKREEYAGAANRSYPIAAQDQTEPQETPFDIVKLSDGTSVDVAKGSSLADLAVALKASGIDAEPLKQVALPDGSYVDAPFSYADEQVLEGMRHHAPDAFGEQPEEASNRGYGAAAKSSFEAGIGSALTGLGGLGAYAGEKLESPLARQAGEYLTGKGKEWQKMGEEAYQELTPEEAEAMGFGGQFRKYVGEPVAGFVGSMGAALPALALPGGAATRIGAFAAQELGGQLAEQERMGQEADVEKALPYAVGSGIVQNSLLGPLKYVTKAFGKPDVLAKIAEITEKKGADAAKQYAGGMMKNILKETGINTGEVVISEVISRAAERAASGQPLDTPDAIAEYEDIAIKSIPGGLLGIPGAFGVHAAKQGTIEEVELAKRQQDQAKQIAAEQQAAEEAAAVEVNKQAEADAELERQAGIGVPEPTIRGQENVAPTEPPLAAEEQPAPVESVSAPPPVAPEISPEAVQTEPEADEIPEPTIRGKEPKLPEAVAPEVTNPADILGLNNRSGLRKQLQGFDINNVEDHPKIEGILQKTSAAFSAENLANLETKMKEVQSANGIQSVAPTEISGIMPSKPEEQKPYAATRQPNIVQEGAQNQPRGTAENFGVPAEENIRGMESLAQRVQDAARVYTEKGRNAAAKLLRESLPKKAGQQNILEYFDRNGETLRTSRDYGAVAREAIAVLGTRTPQGRKWIKQLSRELGDIEQQRTPEGTRESLPEQVGEELRPMPGVPERGEKASSKGAVYSMLPEAEPQQTEARGVSRAESAIQSSPKAEVLPYAGREQKGVQQGQETETPYRATEGAETSEIQGTVRSYVPGAESEAPRKSVQPEIGVEAYAKPEFETGKIRSDVSQLSREGQEIGNVPEGSQGMVEQGREERPIVKGYEGQKPEERKQVSQTVVKLQTPAEAWESLRTPDQPAFESLSKETSKKGIDFEGTAVKQIKEEAERTTPLVKETEAESRLKRGMKEAVSAFKGNTWTRMETNYVNRHAALADAIKDKSTIDSNGKYRADLIGSANDQIFNVISAGITDGVPVYSSAGTVMIQKDTKKNLSNIAKRIDKLNVKNPRVYVGEIARALRGESLKKEDAEALKTIDTLEEKAKKLKAHAKTQSFAEGKKADTLANRYVAEANKLKKRVGEEGREKLVTDEDILEAKRRLAEHPEIQNILDDIHGLMNSLVDLWEASGLASKDVAKDWRSKPSYIPLYMSQEDILSDPSRVVRMMGGGAKSLPNVKALKGGTHAINLLENLQKHYAFMTSAAAQNSYRKAAARDLELFGAAERTSPDDKNAIMFKDNGKEVYYKIADPLMFEAFQAAAPLTNPLLKAAREYTKAFRAVTLVNPLYWYRQLIRDPIHANVVSQTGMVTPIGATISFAKIIAGASPEYAELRRRGAVGAVDSLSDPARFKKIYDKGPNLFKKGADWVMHVHEAADAATRVEVYKAAIKDAKKKGMSKEQAKDYATMRAREIINFAHQGRSETLQAIRATVPFFSAALNSLDSVARAAAGKGLNRREAAEARRLFTSRMLMIASFTTAYALAMQDDEDYLKSPDSINNWLIPTGDKENPFIMIPLPFELGFVAKVIPELIVRLNSGTLTAYEGKKALKEAAGATLTPPLPFPQIIKPAVEAAINYDLHQGRPIVSPSEAGKLPEEQTKGASALSIEMGRQLGLSPAQIEHFGRGYLTELWTAIGVLSDAFLPAGQYKEAKGIAEIPTILGGAKGILSKPDRDRDMDIFYELANGAQQIKRSISAAQGKGDVEAMERIMADPEKKKRFYASDVGRNIGDEISEVSKSIEQIRNDKSITDPKKKQEMIREKQQYKNRLATQGKEWFYSLGVNEP